METQVKRWLGSLPKKCEECGGTFTDGHFYDAPSRQGPWGLLCKRCWTNGGGKLGTGFGQRYDIITGENK